MQPDAGTVLWIAGGLGTAVGLMAVWAWNHTHKRIDEAWKAIDEKASAREVDRQRDHIAGIYEKISALEVSNARIEGILMQIRERIK